MNTTILVILLAMAAFLAAMLSLAASKEINGRIMGVCAAVAIVTDIEHATGGIAAAANKVTTINIKLTVGVNIGDTAVGS